MALFEFDRRGQCCAVDEAVQRETREQRHPADRPALLVRFVLVVARRVRLDARLDAVHVQEPHKQKHTDDAQQDQVSGLVNRVVKDDDRVRYQVEHRDTEHKTAHETERELHPQVGQLDDRWQHPATERGEYQERRSYE